ncbi:MAG: FAD-binding oxidoreductase, partial [Myxococcota bacterium]|nr:FAD-binding oxidoreductase [Myxococcota bacterium]
MATDITEARAVGALTENTSQNMLDRLVGDLDGEARFDRLHRMLYSQDASVYQEEPAGVIFPRTRRDVVRTVELANTLGLPIIPRAAGTSLAGQCVGNGLVMDLGRHMNQILELNVEEKWVRVQPGVILDDLNRYLAPHGLFFGPDTSTSNRCMIGGMIGNNSCGTHSILYGTTRDHLLELEVVFSDGHVHRIAPWDGGELDTSLAEEGALGDGLRALDAIVKEHAEAIRERYPRPSVNRRNTGYAFDEILGMRPYTDGEGGKTFELARLLCGSEGTLGIVTEAKLNLVDAPRKKTVVVAHFDSLQRALEATVVAVEFDPAAVELIDRRILELAAENIEQRRNRFFLEGDPEAILA